MSLLELEATKWRLKGYGLPWFFISIRKKGLITLPPWKSINHKRKAKKVISLPLHDKTPISSSLKEILPIEVKLVRWTVHISNNVRFLILSWVKVPHLASHLLSLIANLTLTGLLLFVLKLGARRQIKYQLNKGNVVETFKRVFGYGAEKIPHGDTLNACLSKLAPENLSNLRIPMIRGLIRKKCFEKYCLLGKYYLIVIGGTG